MRWPAFTLAVRLRLSGTASAAAGLIALIILAGALFPAVGHTIGKLSLPRGAANLLGGADYSTVAGWFKGEIASVYGPLVIAGVAITGAAATTAGEEEERVLSLLLGHPIARARLIEAKAAAVGVAVLIIALACLIGLIAGVAAAGGGVGIGNEAALAAHLAAFGLTTGALALALGAGTGRRALCIAAASGVSLLGYLIAGFAPLVDGLGWLGYLSPYHYYADHDPLRHGLAIGDVAVLALLAMVLTALAIARFERRDLRA